MQTIHLGSPIGIRNSDAGHGWRRDRPRCTLRRFRPGESIIVRFPPTAVSRAVLFQSLKKKRRVA